MKAARLLTRPTWRRGLLLGVAATIEHDGLKERISPNTVVDIGANKGQFTLFALDAFPGCQIYAFEPLPGPAERFRRVLRGIEQVQLFQQAVGPIPGKATIHVSAREDSSSLLPIGRQMERLFPGTTECDTRLISVAPLSSVLTSDDIRPPALLKLDVQGYELEALKGCGDLLSCFDWIYAECSDVELYVGQALRPEVEDFLLARGFQSIMKYNALESEHIGLIQCDILFERRKQPSSAMSSARERASPAMKECSGPARGHLC